MAEASQISWTNDTFNPWIGCARVSPACDHCYAAALMGEEGRWKRVEWGGPGKGAGTRVRTAPGTWAEPLKWNRNQEALWKEYSRLVTSCSSEDPRPDRPEPPPRFVFCASLADVFDNEVPPEWRRDLFDLIRATPALTWLLLTKRPQNIERLFREATDMDSEHDDLSDYWPPNAAIGTTIEDQPRLRLNAPALWRAKKTLKPAFSFWSCEPLLEGLGDLTVHLGFVDWVITGGETDQGGVNARPAHPDWFRSIRDQCAAAGVAYHHKQNGEWAHSEDNPPPVPGPNMFDNDGLPAGDGWRFWTEGDEGANASIRVGKKAAGRLLDGVEHNARPEVRA